jgi:hypothetical protein
MSGMSRACAVRQRVQVPQMPLAVMRAELPRGPQGAHRRMFHTLPAGKTKLGFGGPKGRQRLPLRRRDAAQMSAVATTQSP